MGKLGSMFSGGGIGDFFSKLLGGFGLGGQPSSPSGPVTRTAASPSPDPRPAGSQPSPDQARENFRRSELQQQALLDNNGVPSLAANEDQMGAVPNLGGQFGMASGRHEDAARIAMAAGMTDSPAAPAAQAGVKLDKPLQIALGAAA